MERGKCLLSGMSISTHYKIRKSISIANKFFRNQKWPYLIKKNMVRNRPKANEVTFSLFRLFSGFCSLTKYSTVTFSLSLACYHVTSFDVCTMVNDRLWNVLINSFVLLQTAYT